MKELLFAALFALLIVAPGLAEGRETRGAADQIRAFVERELGALPGRIEISIGALDARADFSACRRIEPFVPAGTRLWGRGAVGLRCADGPAASALLPVEVRVFAPVRVAARALVPGLEVADADTRMEEVEVTRHPPGLVGDLAAVRGQVLARPLAEGQPLRVDQFRLPPAVAAGDGVRVIYRGEGFLVATEGRALNSAAEGQAVRITTAAGRTLTGTARRGRVVEVSF